VSERTLAYLTVVNYAVLAALWTAILALYLRYRRVARKQDALVAVLAAVLALDAFKSVTENVYFGVVWAGNYRLGLVALSRSLSQPLALLVPKLLNTAVALTVLSVVVRRWIPRELRERQSRLDESARLQRELEHSLDETIAKEERWQLALRANQDGIWDWQLADDRIWVSARYEEQLGYEPGSLGFVNRAWVVESIHPEDRNAAVSAIDAFIAGEAQSYNAEFRQRASDGSYRKILSRGAALRDANGVATRVVGSHSDVTAQRDAEQTLAARQRTESLGLLAGGIAHDFNNLLAVFAGNVSVLRDHVGRENARASNALEDLQRAVTRASDLTSRLLAYSGRGRFVIRGVDLSDLGQEMARLLASSAPSHVTIATEFASGIPLVEADAAQMQQLWMNLFTNAVDAIGDSRGTVYLRTRVEDVAAPIPPVVAGEPEAAPGRYVVVEVEDTGVGMTASARARLFDPFFTTKAKGRGLGMSAMLGILRAHRAGLKIRTAPGEGTTFTTYLPASATIAPQVTAPSKSAAPESIGVRRILLADDEPLLRTTIARMLEDDGFAIEVAANGREAIEKIDARAAPYDLGVIDLTMPFVDGKGVLARVRARWPRMPVILMSGYTDEAMEPDPWTQFLDKPFDKKALDDAVRRMLALVDDSASTGIATRV
jgi:PAS domain S-box-containing protein